MEAVSLKVQGLYDRAIAGCRREDEWLAGGAVLELIATLNFEYEGAAKGLFRVYDRCLADILCGRFDQALEVLEALRTSFDMMSALPGPTAAPPGHDGS